MMIALAIAVHDIPEGICTSAPYFYATGRRWKAFLLSASTILPVLAGFFLGRMIFGRAHSFALGTMLGAVAGMMICISCQELIPIARSGRKPILSTFFLLAGILFVLLLGASA